MATIKQLSLDIHQRAVDISQAVIDYHAACPDKKKRDETLILVQNVMLYLDIVIKSLLYRKDVVYPEPLRDSLEWSVHILEEGINEWRGSTKNPSKKNYNHGQCAQFAVVNASKVITELIHQLGGTHELGTV